MPAPLRQDWQQEWGGGLWRWMLDAAQAGASDSQLALRHHTLGAFRAAMDARDWPRLFGTPALCLGPSLTLVLALAIYSGGFPHLRQLSGGLPYRDPQRVVVLAQGPSFFGMRMGFRDREIDTFRARSKTLESIANYMWGYTTFRADRAPSDVLAAEVSSDFFRLLGVGPAFGQPLEPSESFLASDAFWRQQLHGDPSALGQRFEIGGHPMRLAGILPRDFSFLSAPIGVWLLAAPQSPSTAPGRQWWLTLRGAIARLRPGVSPKSVETELRDLLVSFRLARRNFLVVATPIPDLVYRPLWSYLTDFAVALALVLAWAAFHVFRDRRRHVEWRITRRYWAFFIAKAGLPLLALFTFVFEFAAVTRLGITGGARPAGGPFGLWLFYSAIVLILAWALRDQPQRCRVCLERLRQPMRIGIPGQVLLETAGQEVMCPQGHGSVYTSESVHGSELSNRWMGFP